MENYRNLIVWQKSMQLVKEIYKLLRLMPNYEQYALSDQMRRAAVSIPSNIAEGAGRGSKKDFAHFLSIARGSKYELETQLFICIELDYLSEEQCREALSIVNEVGIILNGFIKKLSIQ
ncbi:four helix bundle protein [Ruminococcus sp.]|uniref:four helix bundle protein n=1 Tax=Ruminococcus sp. TaxID=41978 RepID=UPI0025EAF037|nr:four helix bundle protein [Ruminococcus sp.]